MRLPDYKGRYTPSKPSTPTTIPITTNRNELLNPKPTASPAPTSSPYNAVNRGAPTVSFEQAYQAAAAARAAQIAAMQAAMEAERDRQYRYMAHWGKQQAMNAPNSERLGAFFAQNKPGEPMGSGSREREIPDLPYSVFGGTKFKDSPAQEEGRGEYGYTGPRGSAVERSLENARENLQEYGMVDELLNNLANKLREMNGQPTYDTPADFNKFLQEFIDQNAVGLRAHGPIPLEPKFAEGKINDEFQFPDWDLTINPFTGLPWDEEGEEEEELEAYDPSGYYGWGGGWSSGGYSFPSFAKSGSGYYGPSTNWRIRI